MRTQPSRTRHRPAMPVVVAFVAFGIAGPAVLAEDWQTEPAPTRVGDPGRLLSRDLAPGGLPDVGANGPTPKRLEEFVALAERSHPKLRGALAAVETARGKAVQVRLYPNPMVAAGSPQIAGSDSQWNGFATQDIVTAGKLRLSQQVALREVQKAEYELIRARFDVLRNVRHSFYGLLVAQRRVEIYTLLLGIAQRSYDIGVELAKAGEGTKADVLFWSIERDRADVRLLNSAVFVETGRRQLAAAIGLPRADVGTVEADLFVKLPAFDLKELQEAIVDRNAQPRAAEADIARAQWTLERAVVEPIPNVNVMGGYQRQVDFPAQNQGLLQVMVEVPLFDRNQGTIRSARADIATSRANLRTIELDLATQAAETIARYRTAQRLVSWYEEYISPKARENVRLTQLLYGQGEITFLTLLQAQKTLTETELAFVDSQADRWNATVDVADLLQLEVFPPMADAPAASPKDFQDELGDEGRRFGLDPNQPLFQQPKPPQQPPPAPVVPEAVQPLPPP